MSIVCTDSKWRVCFSSRSRWHVPQDTHQHWQKTGSDLVMMEGCEVPSLIWLPVCVTVRTRRRTRPLTGLDFGVESLTRSSSDSWCTGLHTQRPFPQQQVQKPLRTLLGCAPPSLLDDLFHSLSLRLNTCVQTAALFDALSRKRAVLKFVHDFFDWHHQELKTWIYLVVV